MIAKQELYEALSMPLKGRDGGTFEISENVKEQIINNFDEKGLINYEKTG